jgi:hypothetical protein
VYTIRKIIKQLGSVLIISAIGVVAPLVGEEDNNIIVSTATQDSDYYVEEKINNHIYIKFQIKRSEIMSTAYQELFEENENEEETISLEDFYEIAVPENDFKSYMDYRKITYVDSLQYKLQHTVAYTDIETGIRMINGAYCIAIGSGYGASVGDYIELVMENGSIIPCIVSDIKADKDTDSTNKRHSSDGSVAEFIVDEEYLLYYVRYITGDVSSSCENLKGAINYIRVYK